MRKIGIMGGTFNPIHLGHLTLAEWTRDAFALDEVWFIPTGCSYMKTDGVILPGRERLHMTELAVQGNPFFRCLDTEVSREGYSYSYETLEILKDRYPEDEFFFIVGADCLSSIETWKYVDRIFQNCTLIAAFRDGVFSDDGEEASDGNNRHPVECSDEEAAPYHDEALDYMEEKCRELRRRFHADIILFPFFHMSVSSTELRRRIREGKSVRYLIPDSVLQYIEEKGFYRE